MTATLPDHIGATFDPELWPDGLPDGPPGYTAPTTDHQATPTEDRFPTLDWHAAFATDFSQIDWLPGRFMEHGQQVAIVGDGKVGKTLFIHDWLWRAVTGRSFLGDQRRNPLRVLYFDRENGMRDVVTRMQSLGATPDELAGNFIYKMFPKFSGGLDSAAIATTELFSQVEAVKPNVVIFDTVSRFIAGKENESDTWLQFYARVHAPLKARGVAGVRLDHMGKDAEKGGRGSSAKSQDVDHVWEMTVVNESTLRVPDRTTVATEIRLRRTHTRTGLGEDLMTVTRRGCKGPAGMWLPGQTRHELSAATEPQSAAAQVQACVDELIRHGVPGGLGRDKLRDWAVVNGVPLPGKVEVLAQVVSGVKAMQRGAL